MSVDFVREYPNYRKYFVIENLIQGFVLVLVSILLIFGNRLKRTPAYLPFIAYMFFMCIATILRIVFIVVVFVYSSITGTQASARKVTEKDRYQTFIIFIFALIAAVIVQIYIGWTVEKGRRWLLNQQEDAKMEEIVN